MQAEALCHLLGAVRISAAAFVDTDLAMAQAIRMIPKNAKGALFCHLVTNGACTVRSAAQGEIGLRRGDVVAFPAGSEHSLHAVCGQASLICGTFLWDGVPFRPLLNILPSLIVCSNASADTVSNFYSLIADEAGRYGASQQGVLARLAEALIIKIAAAHLASSVDDRACTALWDRHVSQAISLMHRDPTGDWTLVRLSRAVGMSRSALASRFTSLIGIPPIQYLAMWRMKLAAGMLAMGRGSIAQIAVEVGYDSEAAFNRAFKRTVGIPPAAWRRRRQGAQTREHKGNPRTIPMFAAPMPNVR